MRPRAFWRCPQCVLAIGWTYTATPERPLPNPAFLDDEDVGLLIAAHIVAQHSEMLDAGLLERLALPSA